MDDKGFISISDEFFRNSQLPVDEAFLSQKIKVRTDIPFQFDIPVTHTNADPTLTVFHTSTHEDGDDATKTTN